MSFPFDFDPEKFEIREGVQGVWHYHLAEADKSNTLCGEPSMSTKVSIYQWGSKSPSHIPISYCRDCQKEAVKLS